MMPGRWQSQRVVGVARLASDAEALAGRASLPLRSATCQDYDNTVVLKPWGYEYLLFRTGCVAAWVLFIQAQHGTSMHCHPRKTTSLVVLDGSVRCASLQSSHVRHPGEAVQIDAGAFHQTVALSEHGAFVLEVESPQCKTDLVRLRDAYGRENAGYEGTNMHLACLDEQTTLPLPGLHPMPTARDFGATQVRLVSPALLKTTAASVACVVEGGALHALGDVTLRPGECVDFALLRDNELRWADGSAVAVVCPRRAGAALGARPVASAG